MLMIFYFCTFLKSAFKISDDILNVHGLIPIPINPSI